MSATLRFKGAKKKKRMSLNIISAPEVAISLHNYQLLVYRPKLFWLKHNHLQAKNEQLERTK